MVKVKRTCEQCGKEFLSVPSRIKKGQGKFCSRECMGKWHSKYRRGKNHSRWKGGKIKRICEICGREFFVDSNRINAGKAKFCSRMCLGKWISKHLRGKNASNWKGGKIKRICETCGKEFFVDPNQIRQGGGKFCSYKCMGKWFSGKNHPRWQGGISFEPYCHNFNEEFKEYVREKFGRVCFLCPKTEEENGQHLSVHHVNYDKECLCNDNLTCQFVPLCRSCNSKVNSNRKEWEKKINDKMKNKLNGWYI